MDRIYSKFGLVANCVALGLFFLVLVDDLQPSRWLPLQASCSWQLVLLVLMVNRAGGMLRTLALLVGACQSLGYAVVLIVMTLLAPPAWLSISHCTAANGSVDDVSMQQSSDVVQVLVMLGLLVCYVWVLGIVAYEYHNCKPRQCWTVCFNYLQYWLEMSQLVIAVLGMGLLIAEGITPNPYVAVGAWYSLQILLCLFTVDARQIGSRVNDPRCAKRSVYIRDLLLVLFGCVQAALNLGLCLYIFDHLLENKVIARSCHIGSALSTAQQASAGAQSALFLLISAFQCVQVVLLSKRLLSEYKN